MRGLDKAKEFYQKEKELDEYRRIFDKGFVLTSRRLIKSSGYVVDTLEAAIWCLLTTGSYKDAVLKAVNLGDDTDTVGAVTGALAGALYGFNAIPASWLDALLKRDFIENYAN